MQLIKRKLAYVYTMLKVCAKEKLLSLVTKALANPFHIQHTTDLPTRLAYILKMALNGFQTN